MEGWWGLLQRLGQARGVGIGVFWLLLGVQPRRMVGALRIMLLSCPASSHSNGGFEFLEVGASSRSTMLRSVEFAGELKDKAFEGVTYSERRVLLSVNHGL